jgi:DNA replication and repair protein RecF
LDEPVQVQMVRPVKVLRQLSVRDFRVFEFATLEPAPEGTTVLTGPNGSGKTTVLEAVAFLGSQRSFRGAQRDALIRIGTDRGFVRGELREGERTITVEAELSRGSGESRVQVNRKRVRRGELAEAVPCTVFSPDDLALVQKGPGGRRGLLDDALGVLDRRAAVAAEEMERALRQRGAVLRQAGGRATPEIESTLDVWDARLAASANTLVRARRALVDELGPLLEEAYRSLANVSPAPPVTLHYEASWSGDFAAALVERRREDLRRAATTVGPHRDDVAIELSGRDARLQASQGEQRCLALGLRLGLHGLCTTRLGQPPLLLLDDVFSELDPVRARALVGQLPLGQCLLTTASPVPVELPVVQVFDVTRLSA